ncbi:MAG: capsule biosynthesis protein [Rhodobacteraceae bacterium]|nr:MAG: capsule biosynthesis protein [Paracoccaceae bacterium]
MANDETPSDDESKPTPKRTRAYLRKARQKARRIGLEATDDEHAARLLEELGIDVLHDDVSLINVGKTGDSATSPNEGTGISEQVSANVMLNDAERLAEVHAIQRDLIRRRRVRLVLLMARLLFFVVLPTFLVGRYYYTEATDMYETESQFVIQKSESAGASGLGGLFSGTGFANSADSITVQGYLTSREAMMRLDAELGYRAHFQQDFIDDLKRLPEDANMESAYSLYKDNVKVGYDLTEGVIHLEVTAATPEDSQAFSNALIRFAEERVDELSQRVREDQMRGAQQAYDTAETEMFLAQAEVLRLQQTRGVLSADAEIASQMGIINSLELQIEDKLLELAEILDNQNPNEIRADILQREIDRRVERVAFLRQKLTETTTSSVSLATISGELQVAEANMMTRQLMLQQSLQLLETARVDANRQVRYLSIGVTPIAPDVPTYPRKFESTVLAFIIFMGIYIMLSLTIAILREQVSV